PKTFDHIRYSQLHKLSSVAVCANGLSNNEELDYWDQKDKMWKTRDGERDLTTTLSLRTPWILSTNSIKENWEQLENLNSVPQFLTELQCKPTLLHDPKWADLGTVESIKEYYSR